MRMYRPGILAHLIAGLINTGTWTSGPDHVLPQLQDWIFVTHIICVWHNPLDIDDKNKHFIIVSGLAKLFFSDCSARTAFKIKINNLISEANTLGVNWVFLTYYNILLSSFPKIVKQCFVFGNCSSEKNCNLRKYIL